MLHVGKRDAIFRRRAGGGGGGGGPLHGLIVPSMAPPFNTCHHQPRVPVSESGDLGKLAV